MLTEQMNRFAADERVRAEVRQNLDRLRSAQLVAAFEPELKALEELPEGPEAFRDLADKRPGLEKIVRLVARPALLVRNGTFEVPVADSWCALLNAQRSRIERAIASVGRIEVHAATRPPYEGTGWCIAPGIVVTNRHVALEFARSGGGTFVFRNDFRGTMLAPVIDFHEEYRQRVVPREMPISRVAFIAQDDDSEPDVAFLELDPQHRAAWPEPLPLSRLDLAAPDGPASREVVTIGYPAFDPAESNTAAMREIFGGVYDVKRVSPGNAYAAQPTDWFFTHDCTTLGGNSGSVVLDLETGEALGLHFSGTSGAANFAVKATAVAEMLAKSASVAAPAPSHPSVRAPEPEKRTAADYAGRDGYQPGFLGARTGVVLTEIVTPRIARLAPLLDGSGSELRYRHFSVFVDALRRLPVLTAVNIDGTSLRRVPRARAWGKDPRIDAALQFGDELYRDNDLDKGHMVRRLDPVWGTQAEATEANADTFHYSNACPQDHSFNDELWGGLEDYILDSAEEDKRITVLTGPVLADGDPTYRGAQIPRQFWKLVAWRAGGVLRVAAFRLSQEDYLGTLEFNPYRYGTFHVSVADLGLLTDLDFRSLAAADVLADTEAVAAGRRALRTVEDVRI